MRTSSGTLSFHKRENRSKIMEEWVCSFLELRCHFNGVLYVWSAATAIYFFYIAWKKLWSSIDWADFAIRTYTLGAMSMESQLRPSVDLQLMGCPRDGQKEMWMKNHKFRKLQIYLFQFTCIPCGPNTFDLIDLCLFCMGSNLLRSKMESKKYHETSWSTFFGIYPLHT